MGMAIWRYLTALRQARRKEDVMLFAVPVATPAPDKAQSAEPGRIATCWGPTEAAHAVRCAGSPDHDSSDSAPKFGGMLSRGSVRIGGRRSGLPRRQFQTVIPPGSQKVLMLDRPSDCSTWNMTASRRGRT